MKTAAFILASLVAAGALAAGASPGPGASAQCSASKLPAARAVTGLPKAVAALRLRIVAAARRCDYAALERIGNERGTRLAFSYGADRSAAAYWRKLERAGAKPPPMAALVKIFAMPSTRFEGFHVWPSAHRLRPTERDWQALRTLYTPAQIEQMKHGGIGYIGYRAGITPAGDWVYFISGD